MNIMNYELIVYHDIELHNKQLSQPHTPNIWWAKNLGM